MERTRRSIPILPGLTKVFETVAQWPSIWLLTRIRKGSNPSGLTKGESYAND